MLNFLPIVLSSNAQKIFLYIMLNIVPKTTAIMPKFVRSYMILLFLMTRLAPSIYFLKY